MSVRAWMVGLLLALVLGAGVAEAGRGKLDGKTFKVMITEPGRKAYPDTLVFTNGTFDAAECHQYGFKATPYTGDAGSFATTAKSEKEGTIVWSGTVKGDAIEGKLAWTKAGQAAITYTFAGALQK